MVASTIFDSILIDCKIVEIPPKLITKDASKIAINLFGESDSEMQPFVISTKPCKKAQMLGVKREKIGFKHSITMKNIVIIQPTHNIERVEFKTISLMSVCDCFSSVFCAVCDTLSLKLRQQMPFVIAPKM